MSHLDERQQVGTLVYLLVGFVGYMYASGLCCHSPGTGFSPVCGLRFGADYTCGNVLLNFDPKDKVPGTNPASPHPNPHPQPDPDRDPLNGSGLGDGRGSWGLVDFDALHVPSPGATLQERH